MDGVEYIGNKVSFDSGRNISRTVYSECPLFADHYYPKKGDSIRIYYDQNNPKSSVYLREYPRKMQSQMGLFILISLVIYIALVYR